MGRGGSYTVHWPNNKNNKLVSKDGQRQGSMEYHITVKTRRKFNEVMVVDTDKRRERVLTFS